MTTKMEFAVDMTCQNCVKKVEESLGKLKGIQGVDVSLERGTVVVQTHLPYSEVQETIEKSGKRAVLKGYGDGSVSAVSMVGGTSGFGINKAIQGVVRFVQTPNVCIIDGTVDGLSPGAHGIHVHECGDISAGCDTVGEHFNPYNAAHGGPDDDITRRHVGDLGNIVADNSGRARFRLQDKVLSVDDIIGRSLVITQDFDDLGKGDSSKSKVDGNSGRRLACGIIARSSGVFENTKKICACDGKTLWDERDDALQKVHGNKL
ncbi:copper chaperone for superoxide dismutase [Diachasmimorpha longicaudata]|uniref:copper chaperone for superoxide dismutase n=1 Tax=Diachasmimorpha longicaudata TaxID=58733 RepID=UPI0030B87107